MSLQSILNVPAANVEHYNQVAGDLQRKLERAGALINWHVLRFGEYMTGQLISDEQLAEIGMTEEEYYLSVQNQVEVRFGISINGHRLQGHTFISRELLEDAAVDPVSLVTGMAIDAIAEKIKNPGELPNDPS